MTSPSFPSCARAVHVVSNRLVLFHRQVMLSPQLAAIYAALGFARRMEHTAAYPSRHAATWRFTLRKLACWPWEVLQTRASRPSASTCCINMNLSCNSTTGNPKSPYMLNAILSGAVSHNTLNLMSCLCRLSSVSPDCQTVNLESHRTMDGTPYAKSGRNKPMSNTRAP